MNIRFLTTKVFAFFYLLFAMFISVSAQIDSSIYQLLSGTKIRVQMDDEINSKVSSKDDTFTVKISEPLKIRESVVLPVGTIIEGRITKVRRASSGGKDGSLEVSFETLRLANGDKRNIEGVLVDKPKIESSKTANVLTIVGGTAVGIIVGAVSKISNGVLVGAGIGAGVGTGIAFLKKGKDVKIRTDQEFEIELMKNVNLPVEDY